MIVATAHLLVAAVPTPAPPVWPPAFSGAFVESFAGGWGPAGPQNIGRWLYDDSHNRSRFEHGDGQHNNFCGCADNTTDAACHLYFEADGAMWANFPATENCCRLCAPGDGCTTLRRDWLSGGSFVGNEQIGGKQCETWSKQGSVAIDFWSQTADGTACQYREKFTLRSGQVVWHYLNFTSWDTATPDPELFTLPKSCTAPCEHAYPNCG